MRRPVVIILLAGIGGRLGLPYPKGLTPLTDGETIFSRQLSIFRRFGLTVMGVVGFKKELIMEADPGVLYAYNPNFDITNTSKSLLCGLQHIRHENVLWINGDVVFEPEIIERMLHEEGSWVAVNNALVGKEEVKYAVDDKGYISAISKEVKNPLGEALGINLIQSKYLNTFKKKLETADSQDYFERGMELLIEDQGPVFRPLPIGELFCIEVDFQEDLDQARHMVSDPKRR
ncbi:MAG TPA: phosphocholine cytidylyltransferase family protein [Desulfobacterales bacterium]|nr:phosphocholine cytidylyltransferase family protein [Desulfobacterales bacterium]